MNLRLESAEFIVKTMSLDAGPRRVSADGKERMRSKMGQASVYTVL